MSISITVLFGAVSLQDNMENMNGVVLNWIFGVHWHMKVIGLTFYGDSITSNSFLDMLENDSIPFYSEDGGDTFLQKVSSHKNYTAPHPRNGILHSYRHENLKSHIKMYCFLNLLKIFCNKYIDLIWCCTFKFGPPSYKIKYTVNEWICWMNAKHRSLPAIANCKCFKGHFTALREKGGL
jgi:hypothetical protein